MTVRYNTNLVQSGLASLWDPANLKCVPAENLLVQSEALATSPWAALTGTGGTLTATDNSLAAPDGTNTATLFNVTTWASGSSFYQDIAASGTGTYKFFIYYKPGTQTTSITFAMFFTGSSTQGFNAVFNGTTGALISQSGFDASSTSVGGGWFRLAFKATGTVAGNNTVRFQVYFAGTGTAYFWGAQVTNIDAPDTYVKSLTLPVGSSSTLFDATPNNNDIPIVGRPTHSQDGGGSFLFGGLTTQKCILTTTTGLPSGDLTMMAWVKPDATQPLPETYTGILAYGARANATPSTAVGLGLNTTNSTFSVSMAFWNNDYVPNSASVRAISNQWNLVGLIARSAPLTNNVTLFSFNSSGYNSVTESSTAFSRGLRIANGDLTYGSLDAGNTRLIKGNIGLTMIYGRRLSEDEIKQNIQATRTRYGL